MTTRSPIFYIVDGPPVGDLSIAHYWRKQGTVHLPLTIALRDKYPEHGTMPTFELTVSIDCSGGNGPDEYMISGVPRGLPIVAEDLGEDILRLKRAYEEFGPYYRAFFSTKSRKGRLTFSKRPLIPYHHPIFDDPMDKARELIQEMILVQGVSPWWMERLKLIDILLTPDYERGHVPE